MARVIGILGGISPASTAAYYRRITSRYHELRGDYSFPQIIVNSVDFQRLTELENSGDRVSYVEELVAGIRVLERAGASFGIIAANSPHAVFDQVAGRAAIPLLSIVEVTAREAVRRGLTDLLLLGIKFTMQGTFYREALGRRGIAVVTPLPGDQDRIEAIIFGELARNIITRGARDSLIEIVARYPAGGVILGCTELPLLLGPGDLPVPALDTLALHADAALDYALEEGAGR